MKTFTRVEPTQRIEVGDKFKQQVVIKRFKTDDGLEHEFTTFCAEDCVSAVVFALTESGEIIVTRQFRAGPGDWRFQLPGGGALKDEDITLAAQRELEEETGYEAGTIEYLGTCRDDAYINVTQHVCYATNCKKLAQPMRIRDELEDQQGMEVHVMPVSELLEKVRQSSTCDNGAILMGYLRYQKELNI